MRRFGRILYIETHPRGSGRGFSCAAGLAAAHGADLTVLHAVRDRASLPFTAPGTAERRAARLRRRRRQLTPLVERGGVRGVSTTVRVVEGDPVETALREVEAGAYDLVVKVADEREPVRAWLLGRADRLLLRRCPCPVWVLDPAQHGGLRVVLAAVDVSPGRSESLNRSTLRVAADVAAGAGAALHVAHAWSLVGEPLLADPLTGVSRRRLRDLRRGTARRRRESVEALVDAVLPGREVAVELRKGRPFPTLRRMARTCEADVVVVGSSGGDGLGRLLLGSVAERLVGSVPGSVLVVRGDTAVPASSRTTTSLAMARHAYLPASLEVATADVAAALMGSGFA